MDGGVDVAAESGERMTGAGQVEAGLRQVIQQLRLLQREAVRPDGLHGLLRQVARGIDGHAALLDDRGRIVDAFPRTQHERLAAIACETYQAQGGRFASITTQHDTQTVVILSITERPSGPFLLAVAEKAAIAQARELLADAARLLWLCWQVTEADRGRDRLDHADAQMKEAVLHLLMLGDSDAATRVATTLGFALADPTRVLVAEYEPGTGTRDDLIVHCIQIYGNQAWIVRCPVYTRQVIIIAPDDAAEADRGRPPTSDDPVPDREPAFTTHRGGLHVGASEAVPLRDAATGYEQAFHALATAKSAGRQYARFNPHNELASLLGPAGRTWARTIMTPLADYLPARPHDPNAHELITTLTAWLAFYNGATRQLKIHRNTLTARLNHIERLLRCDTRDIATQAILDLSLRTLRQPPAPPTVDRQESREATLDTTAAQHWARTQLAPLLTDDTQPMLATLRAWLANNTRLDLTGTSIGISVPGTRKRLLRIEGMLQRSVLHGPSARYDLWHALRIHDGQRTLPRLRRTPL